MKLVPLIIVLALAACVTNQPRQVPMTDYGTEAEWAPYHGLGTGVLEGQAFLRQQGGGVVTCAGQQVSVFPATPSMRKAVEAGRREGAMVELVNAPAYVRGGRQTICDAQGNFRVDQLPAGAWFVETNVVWQVGYSRQGGVLLGEVVVPENGVGQLYLTDANFVRR